MFVSEIFTSVLPLSTDGHPVPPSGGPYYGGPDYGTPNGPGPQPPASTGWGW
jgi:hypothetical protein